MTNDSSLRDADIIADAQFCVLPNIDYTRLWIANGVETKAVVHGKILANDTFPRQTYTEIRQPIDCHILVLYVVD